MGASIGIFDADNNQFQSYLADILRVFQLLFEILYTVICTCLFLYIAPHPMMHKMHRESTQFHPSIDYMEDSNEQKYGIANVGNVLLPQTKVYIKDEDNEWMLGSVNKLTLNQTLVYVTKYNDEFDVVVIDLSGSEAANIKLALFGINAMYLPKDDDYKYDLNEIPMLLIALRNKLFDCGGYCAEQIFANKAQNKSEYDLFKFAIEQNRMQSFEYDGFDVHILSNLILDFFDSLPIKALQGLHFDDDKNKTINDMEMSLDEQSKVLIIWLWNLCADIFECSNENKMTIRTLAVVIAPILYFYESNQHEIEQRVVAFCELGIEYILHQRRQ